MILPYWLSTTGNLHEINLITCNSCLNQQAGTNTAEAYDGATILLSLC
jgi:hypothetical protein